MKEKGMERIVTEEIREDAEGNPVEIVQTERDLVISRLESMNEAYNPQFSTRILKNMLKDAICVRL